MIPSEKKNHFGKRFAIVVEVFTNERIKNGLLQSLPFWMASLLVGFTAVIYTMLFNFAESVLHRLLAENKALIFVLTPVFFLAAWLTVKLFSTQARGSGIPQVMAALELSPDKYSSGIEQLLGFKVIVVKIVSSILMVLGGAAIGREGPTIQVAGAVFRIVQGWIPQAWPKLSQKNFILTGAAAGLAAAFNTPLGGIVFAIEELAKIHLSFFRTPLFAAVIISGLTAQAILGPYLYLGYPDVSDAGSFMYLVVIFTAIISGIAGSGMCKILHAILHFKRSLGIKQTVLFIVFLSLSVSAIAFFVNYKILGSGKLEMNSILFTQNKSVSLSTVLVRIFGPVISFCVGASGGIFAPALAAGASVGGFLADLFGYIGPNANLLIVTGMVGFLTGVTRTPFTSAILVLEMTDRHSVIFYLMLSALFSNIAALLIEKHSFYEQLKFEYMEEVKQSNDNQVQ